MARGGWPQVPPVERLRVGNRHASVAALRERLSAVGDLGATSSRHHDIFNSYVEAAVRRFQARHGINADGTVREQTFKALNVPADVRLAQLKLNLTRLRSVGNKHGNRFVMCNIPAAQIEAIENGVAVSRHTAVVGKPDRPSPEINSRIMEINFNPYWTVPVSIVRRDLIPRMQTEPDYLTKNHIRIFDQKNRELQPTQVNWQTEEAVNYQFKQDPGELNSLGSVAHQFPQRAPGLHARHAVQESVRRGFPLPLVGLRAHPERARAGVLAAARDAGLAADGGRPCGQARRAQGHQARSPVPLHWVYVTAWATADGVVQFRDDIYGRDGLGTAVNSSSG